MEEDAFLVVVCPCEVLWSYYLASLKKVRYEGSGLTTMLMYILWLPYWNSLGHLGRSGMSLAHHLPPALSCGTRASHNYLPTYHTSTFEVHSLGNANLAHVLFE